MLCITYFIFVALRHNIYSKSYSIFYVCYLINIRFGIKVIISGYKKYTLLFNIFKQTLIFEKKIFIFINKKMVNCLI